MTMDRKIVIVGAGPVGLVAAIELARRGYAPRIIDRKSGPAPESRALGVNARSLALLEPSGASALIMARGNRLRHFTLHGPDRRLATIALDDFDGPYPPIVSLPQGEVELALVEVLARFEIGVDWQTDLVSLEPDGEGSLLNVRHDGSSETVRADIVIGADGSRSLVRQSIGLSFAGEAYDTEWGLADVHVRTELALDGVNAFDLSPVMFVAIPIRDNLVRLVCDLPDVLNHVPPQIEVLDVVWQSRFRIAHRQVESYQRGNVFLAGDSAHVHSPLGARGMNLGMEDAAWLAWQIAEGRTDAYSADRLPVGREVVTSADPATRLMSSDGAAARFIRRHVLPVAVAIAPLRRRALRQMSGMAAPPPPWLS